MEMLFTVTAGVDVHKDTAVVTVRRLAERGRERQETRTFETFHDSLGALSAWMVEAGVQALTVESTGVYWKPLVRVLKEKAPSVTVWVVNPHHVQKVPGRKTDVSDSQWLAKLVMYGLVSPSFLPSTALDELRKLTRHRTKLVSDQVRHENRIIKELEASGVKLDSVCSEALGKSGRAMIDAILEGQTEPDTIANLAKGRLRNKIALLRRAVAGSFSSSTIFVLRQLLRRLDAINADVEMTDAQIAVLMQPMQEDAALLCTAPGFDRVTCAAILAEMGPDMSVFHSAKHLAAWAGVSPGSYESAGTAKKGPARKGDKYLRTSLVQVAWCAVRKKGSHWQARFNRLVRRLGRLKAIVAIARGVLVAAYHMLRDRKPYQEPSPVTLDPTARDRLARRYTTQLEALGFAVQIRASSEPVS